jgi:hypothetical protein
MRRDGNMRGSSGLIMKLSGLKTEAIEDRLCFIEGNLDAKQGLKTRVTKDNMIGAPRFLLGMNCTTNGRALSEPSGETASVSKHLRTVVAINTTLKAMAGFGMHAVASSGSSNASRIEVGALEQDSSRCGSYLCVLPAHYACESNRTFGIADEKIIGIKTMLDAVERRHHLTVIGLANNDARTSN